MGGSRPVRSSDYGPSFVFETSRTILDEALLQTLVKRTLEPLENIKLSPVHYMTTVMDYGYIPFHLDGNCFSSNAESLTLSIFPFEHNGTPCEDLFSSFYNEGRYNYAIFDFFIQRKGDNPFSKEPRSMPVALQIMRRETFHEVLKAWILALQPHFVWGDDFPLLKKHENQDSRFRVWSYNYYSDRLVKAIGRDRIIELIEGTSTWYGEDFNGGVLLIGYPDPYAIGNAVKNDARKFLDLDGKLGIVVNKKKPLPRDPRPAPPKGVIEQ
jgi:hypothetical protein